ncbi:glucoside xylosyltransferase 2-like [Haemaphysalis longicornis]
MYAQDTSAYYVDAAPYPGRPDAYAVAVISAATGALKTAASIRTTHTTLAEEFAIALALTQLPCTTIISDSRLAILRFATNQLAPATLRICTPSRAPAKLARLTWFPAHTDLANGGTVNRNAEADAAARALASRAAVHDPARSVQQPPPKPTPLLTYGEILAWYRDTRRKYPPPHPDLPRAESTILRQLQTEAIWTPVFAKHICPTVYPTDHCQHCYAARATTPHLLWDCRPPEDTQDPMPPSMALAIRSDDIGQKRGTVRQVMDILARHIVKLVVVTCGQSLNVTLVNLKSAVVFTSVALELLLFADDANMKPLRKAIASWPSSVRRRIRYSVRPLYYPGPNGAEWRNLFKPCASQRLFLPGALAEVDAVIYADSDVLFLSPLEDLWHFFETMNDSQLAAMAPNREDNSTNCYRKSTKHPFYQPLGLNSGVMLMNLTRMRAFHWERWMNRLLRKYRKVIRFGDQDVLNILFSIHPERVLVFPCSWNYRSDHCDTDTCSDRAPALVHGNRNLFANHKEPAFWEIHQAMKMYKFGENLEQRFVEPLRVNLAKASKTPCVKVFLKQLSQWQQEARRADTAITKKIRHLM